MAYHHHTPTPPGKPAWDIGCTRLTRSMQPRIEACALELGQRFGALGLRSDKTVRQTPRGLSTFLALVGPRGLICIVDMTLVDGMAVGDGPSVALDIRLLDACGDVVADRLAGDPLGCTLDETSVLASRIAERLDRAATVVYVATLGHFDVLRPTAGHA
jgi:hypothetical protein